MAVQAVAAIELKWKQLRGHAGEPSPGDGEEPREGQIIERESASNQAEDVRLEKAGARGRGLKLANPAQDSRGQLRGDRVDQAEKPVPEDDMPPISPERARIECPPATCGRGKAPSSTPCTRCTTPSPC